MVKQGKYDEAVKVMEALRDICLETPCSDCPFCITEANRYRCLIGKIETPLSIHFDRAYLQKPEHKRFKPTLCKLICSLEETEAFVTTVCAIRQHSPSQGNSFEYIPYLRQLVVRIGDGDNNIFFNDGCISPNDIAVSFTEEIINEEIQRYRDSIGEKK